MATTIDDDDNEMTPSDDGEEVLQYPMLHWGFSLSQRIMAHFEDDTYTDRLAITRGDLRRLEPLQYLNDNLINFYIRFFIIHSIVVSFVRVY